MAGPGERRCRAPRARRIRLARTPLRLSSRPGGALHRGGPDSRVPRQFGDRTAGDAPLRGERAAARRGRGRHRVPGQERRTPGRGRRVGGGRRGDSGVRGGGSALSPDGRRRRPAVRPLCGPGRRRRDHPGARGGRGVRRGPRPAGDARTRARRHGGGGPARSRDTRRVVATHQRAAVVRRPRDPHSRSPGPRGDALRGAPAARGLLARARARDAEPRAAQPRGRGIRGAAAGRGLQRDPGPRLRRADPRDPPRDRAGGPGRARRPARHPPQRRDRRRGRGIQRDAATAPGEPGARARGAAARALRRLEPRSAHADPRRLARVLADRRRRPGHAAALRTVVPGPLGRPRGARRGAAALRRLGSLVPPRSLHRRDVAPGAADPGAARRRRPGSARRSLGAGRHRAARRRAADPLSRLPRQPHRAGQPPLLRGEGCARAERCATAAPAAGRAVPRPRPVQEHQRLARSLGRRCDPAGDRVAPARRGTVAAARLGSLGASGGAARRRRVHDPSASAGRRGRRDRGGPRHPAPGVGADPARQPVARGHRQRRHRGLARRRCRRRRPLARQRHRDVLREVARPRPGAALHRRADARGRGGGSSSRRGCARRSSATISSCTTSRASTPAPAASSASRRSCAGATRTWASCRPPTSSRSRKTPG